MESKNDEEEQEIVIPKRLEVETGLKKVSSEYFKEEQMNCPLFKQLWEKTSKLMRKNFV